jgi:hypothetical protein
MVCSKQLIGAGTTLDYERGEETAKSLASRKKSVSFTGILMFEEESFMQMTSRLPRPMGVPEAHVIHSLGSFYSFFQDRLSVPFNFVCVICTINHARLHDRKFDLLPLCTL